MDKRVGLKRYELNGRKVLFYFDEVSFTQMLPNTLVSVCVGLCVCVVMEVEEVSAQGEGRFAFLLLYPFPCVLLHTFSVFDILP